MRFPRQARIFRGHLDPAAFAAVMFLLVIFMQISTLLYTPGVLIQLQEGRPIKNPAATIRITADGRVLFGTNIFTEVELEMLRPVLKASSAGPPFGLAADSSAPARLVEKVRDLFGMRLPEGAANLVGTTDAKVVVAVSFLGQYFYDQRPIGDEDLKQELKKRLQAASRESKGLILMIWADEQVDLSSLTRLERLAREAGLTNAMQVERSMPAPAGSPKTHP